MSEEIKTIKLKHPIRLEKDGKIEEIGELKIGRLKLKHIKKFPKGLFDEGKTDTSELMPVLPSIVSSMAGISEEEADEIDMDDVEPIAEALGTFFDNTQATDGNKSSG